ncbi:hypothetical protein HMPREF3293_03139 [Christensenella minuta]|uniref:Uncharacterized protein n=1 Tax=Christensenella minuta TaxID=626937 RepID=A0A136Q071_9FIRM|nr:hypothetical protein HMPREF3293_03139 [Christensenella minuta]
MKTGTHFMRSVSCEFVKFGVVSFGFFCFLKEKRIEYRFGRLMCL